MAKAVQISPELAIGMHMARDKLGHSAIFGATSEYHTNLQFYEINLYIRRHLPSLLD